MALIFHLTYKDAWETARPTGEYTASSLADEVQAWPKESSHYDEIARRAPFAPRTASGAGLKSYGVQEVVSQLPYCFEHDGILCRGELWRL